MAVDPVQEADAFDRSPIARVQGKEPASNDQEVDFVRDPAVPFFLDPGMEGPGVVHHVPGALWAVGKVRHVAISGRRWSRGGLVRQGAEEQVVRGLDRERADEVLLAQRVKESI